MESVEHLSVDEILDTTPPRQHTLYVSLAGGLINQASLLADQLRAARAEDSLDSSSAEIRAELDALRQQIEARRVPFVLEDPGRETLRKLVAAHPPRKDDEGDVLLVDRADDVNVDEFEPALIRACLVSPTLDDARWAKVATLAGTAEVGRLYQAARDLTGRTVDVAFFSDVLRRIVDSAAGSKKPNDSASASDDSMVGPLEFELSTEPTAV